MADLITRLNELEQRIQEEQTREAAAFAEMRELVNDARQQLRTVEQIIRQQGPPRNEAPPAPLASPPPTEEKASGFIGLRKPK